MATDVYHKVLQKLYEVTEGKNSKAVNFRDLVKVMGFTGHYPDIFERLSGEGWITETPKADFVFITHWGVGEAKKSLSPQGADSKAEIKREINKSLSSAKELSLALEDFAQNPEPNSFPAVDKKFNELQNTINQIKKSLGLPLNPTDLHNKRGLV